MTSVQHVRHASCLVELRKQCAAGEVQGDEVLCVVLLVKYPTTICLVTSYIIPWYSHNVLTIAGFIPSLITFNQRESPLLLTFLSMYNLRTIVYLHSITIFKLWSVPIVSMSWLSCRTHPDHPGRQTDDRRSTLAEGHGDFTMFFFWQFWNEKRYGFYTQGWKMIETWENSMMSSMMSSMMFTMMFTMRCSHRILLGKLPAF